MMKISAVALGVLLATASQASLVYAKDPINTNNKPVMRKVNIQLNVLPSVNGYLSGNINIQISSSSAVGVYGGFNTIVSNMNGLNSSERSNFNLGVQYSYALNGQYMSTGWLVKPFIGYNYASNDYDRWDNHNYGVMIDHQWVFDNGMMVQVGIGPKYIGGCDTYNNKYQEVSIEGEINLGYAF